MKHQKSSTAFLILVGMMLPFCVAARAEGQSDASLVPIKPKWVVEDMNAPAVFVDSHRLLSVEKRRRIKMRGLLSHANQLRTFDIENGKPAVQLEFDKFPGNMIPKPMPAAALKFYPGDALTIATSSDRSVILTAERKQLLSLTPRGLLNRSDNVTELTLWDAKSLSPKSVARHADLEHIYLSVSPNGKRAVLWGRRKLEGTYRRVDTMVRFDLSAGKIARQGEGMEFPGYVSALKMLNDGTVVVACNRLYARDGAETLVRDTAYHLLMPDDKLVPLWKPSYLQPVVIADSPDSKTVALSGTEGRGSEAREVVFVFDVATQRKLWQPAVEKLYRPRLAFSPDGAYLAIATGRNKDAHVGLWSMKTRQVEKRLEVAPVERTDSSGPYLIHGANGSLDFSPDGKSLVGTREMGNLGTFFCVWSLE